MYSSTHLKRSWVEVDLEQIRENYRIYKKSVQSNEIMAVVKADAYGHGDVQIANTLQSEGVRLFAVSNVEEALALRTSGITGEILILGCPQFASDAGMNRIGLDADNPEYCEEIVRKYFEGFELSCIFMHLCVADTKTADCIHFTEQQIQKFGEVVRRVKNLKLPYVHCMNSAGGLFHKINEHFANIIRLGIILYGLKPDYLNGLPDGIKPALEWKSVIAIIQNVHPGESIGYGRIFIAEHEMKVATIPTGYADGCRRELSNKGIVR